MTTRSDETNVIVRFFEWWNAAMEDESRLTATAFGQHFTSDGVLVVNGNCRAVGCNNLAAHYRRIQSTVDEVTMTLPVVAEASSDGLDFVHVYSNVVEKGERRTLEAMAYARKEGGKIRELRVLSS